MTTRAVLFGAIGTIAETSELQRDAFNAAFAEAGLDWTWDREEYRDMLETPGGERRIEDYNRARGARIDASAIHARKSGLFQERLERGIDARPGVVETIAALRAAGIKTAFCTTTEEANVAAIIRAVSGLEREHFDFIGHRGMVSKGKPDPEIYMLAIERLGVDPAEAVAVEDSPESADAAAGAGLRTIAFPGAMHVHRSFESAELAVDTMTPQALGLRAEGRSSV